MGKAIAPVPRRSKVDELRNPTKERMRSAVKVGAGSKSHVAVAGSRF